MNIKIIVLSALITLLSACGGGSSSTPSSYIGLYDKELSEKAVFLSNSTFGYSLKELNDFSNKEDWIQNQFNMNSAYTYTTDDHLSYLERTIEIVEATDTETDWYRDNNIFNSRTGSSLVEKSFSNVLLENYLGNHPTYPKQGRDQLRQKVAYILSQILVISTKADVIISHGESAAVHGDILAKNAFGNYGDILLEVAKSASMGNYLSHRNNDGRFPDSLDENFARELMQLFTIGLYQLNDDGTFKLGANGNKIPNYTQSDVRDLAKVMTGYSIEAQSFGSNALFSGDYMSRMRFTDAFHFKGEKTLFGKKLSDGEESMKESVDILMAHRNIAPNISKKLIKLMVTSNPSKGYVSRVTKVFRDNGSGVSGDMKAVIYAILMDDQATKSDGKIREPFLSYTHALKAFNVKPVKNWVNDRSKTPSDFITYSFRDMFNYLGQAPYKADSVFNFYDTDFTPSVEYSEKDKTDGVAQILSVTNIARTNDIMRRIVYVNDVTYITDILDTDIENWSSLQSIGTPGVLTIDFINEYNIMKSVLTSDYSDIKDSKKKKQAVEKLLIHLNKLLVSSRGDEVDLESLSNYLVSINGPTNYETVYRIIRDATYLIMSSPQYQLQRGKI